MSSVVSSVGDVLVGTKLLEAELLVQVIMKANRHSHFNCIYYFILTVMGSGGGTDHFNSSWYPSIRMFPSDLMEPVGNLQ